MFDAESTELFILRTTPYVLRVITYYVVVVCPVSVSMCINYGCRDDNGMLCITDVR